MSKENEKAQNSAEKAMTYKAMTARYKLAMKHGFLYEAMLHGQTILEDRLDAFLWAAGVIAEPDGTSLGNRRTRPLLTEIICKYTETAKPAPLRSIGGKTAAVRALLLFANDTPAPWDAAPRSASPRGCRRTSDGAARDLAFSRGERRGDGGGGRGGGSGALCRAAGERCADGAPRLVARGL